MATAEAIVEELLRLVTEATEAVLDLVDGDRAAVDEAESILFGRRVESSDDGPRTWPGDQVSWSRHQAVFDLLFGVRAALALES